ncbi:MAG: hypothetical protein QOJ45_1902 [Verrucomicrobiota bacterium]|jgi:hypothetical protein
MFRRIALSGLRITLAVVAFFFLLWWFGMRMPGRNVSTIARFSAADIALRAELVADVQMLAGDIGERNLHHYAQLNRAADFIEDSFSRAGLQPRRDTYELEGRACHNIEAEVRGARSQILMIGAHYDSVFGSPGANDNASGVAALLALARRFAGKPAGQTLRFVAFVNEEPPYFKTEQMGSLVYAKRCKAHGDEVSAMISLETMGFFSDALHSQKYPSRAIGAFYPRTGNFIGFVGNLGSRALVRRGIGAFREQEKVPSEGAALPSFIPGVGWSDQWSFWQCGYPAIMVTDTAPFRYPHYHEGTDTPDKLEYDRFTLVVSALEKTIVELAR